MEVCSDICEGTSKANSGIVHAGFDAETGSLMAKLNIRGHEFMGRLSKDLDFSFRRNGSLVLCFEEEGLVDLEKLYELGRKNGVPDLRILTKEEAKELEPGISEKIAGALYAPTGGIVCPFGLTIAMEENAAENGVEFYRICKVNNVYKAESGYIITTGAGKNYETALVINVAGVYADVIHNMLPITDVYKEMKIIPRKGEYCLYDKKVGTLMDKTIFRLPEKYGKGVLVPPTVHGNLLTGPIAEDISDKEGVNTTEEGIAKVLSKSPKSVEELPEARQIIISFYGLWVYLEIHDFVIEESKEYPGFINVAGIESPGLTSAPAIGEYVAEIVEKIAPVPDKEDFIFTRKGIKDLSECSMEEQQKKIAENPAYGNIICRCESF